MCLLQGRCVQGGTGWRSTGHLPKFKTAPHPLATHLLLSSPFVYLGGTAINLVAKPSATGPLSVNAILSAALLVSSQVRQIPLSLSFLPSLKLMLGCLATIVMGHLRFKLLRLPGVRGPGRTSGVVTFYLRKSPTCRRPSALSGQESRLATVIEIYV